MGSDQPGLAPVCSLGSGGGRNTRPLTKGVGGHHVNIDTALAPHPRARANDAIAADRVPDFIEADEPAHGSTADLAAAGRSSTRTSAPDVGCSPFGSLGRPPPRACTG